VVREERVTADPRSPTMLETFRRVGGERRGSECRGAEESGACEGGDGSLLGLNGVRVWVVEALRDVALVWEV
jgi:hypothetical protein